MIRLHELQKKAGEEFELTRGGEEETAASRYTSTGSVCVCEGGGHRHRRVVIISLWLNFSGCGGQSQTTCVASSVSGSRHDVTSPPVNREYIKIMK